MLLSGVHVFLLSYLKLLQQPPAKVNILSARGGNGGKVWLFQKIANHHLKWLVTVWPQKSGVIVSYWEWKGHIWILKFDFACLPQLFSLACHFCQFGCEYNDYNV